MLANIGLPTPEAITDYTSYREEKPEATFGSNGYVGTMGLQQTSLKQEIPQASEVMTARAHPTLEHLIAVKTGGSNH